MNGYGATAASAATVDCRRIDHDRSGALGVNQTTGGVDGCNAFVGTAPRDVRLCGVGGAENGVKERRSPHRHGFT